MLSSDEHAKQETEHAKQETEHAKQETEYDPRADHFIVLTPRELADSWDKVVYNKPKAHSAGYGYSIGVRYMAPNMKDKLVKKTISVSSSHPYWMPFGVKSQMNKEKTEVTHYQACYSLNYQRGKDAEGSRQERLIDEDGLAWLDIQRLLMQDVVSHSNEWGAGVDDMSELAGKDDMCSKGRFNPIVRWSGKKNDKTKMFDFNDMYGPRLDTKISFTTRTEQDDATGEELEVHVLDTEMYDADGEMADELTNLMLDVELPKQNRTAPLIDLSGVWCGNLGVSVRLYTSQIQSFKRNPRGKGRLQIRARTTEEAVAEEEMAGSGGGYGGGSGVGSGVGGSSATAGSETPPGPTAKPTRPKPTFNLGGSARRRPKISLAAADA